MRKNVIYSIMGIFIIASLAGCGTVPKNFKEEVGGIKSRVETLESKIEGIESRQAETERLAGEHAQMAEERKSARSSISVKRETFKTKESIKEIQTCLKNAGFYQGEIDGVRGRRTRRAVREFQKANGLDPDGIVGRRTGELLNKYMEANGGPEERAAK